MRAGGLHCQANILENHVHYKDKCAYGITMVIASFAFVEILLFLLDFLEETNINKQTQKVL